jgi:hypothetical protein
MNSTIITMGPLGPPTTSLATLHIILREMHNVPYAGNPGYQKAIASVKSQYYWPGMKKEVVDFIVKCLECQKIKYENRHPASFLCPLPIPEWK